jgi:hypothetical protein
VKTGHPLTLDTSHAIIRSFSYRHVYGNSVDKETLEVFIVSPKSNPFL